MKSNQEACPEAPAADEAPMSEYPLSAACAREVLGVGADATSEEYQSVFHQKQSILVEQLGQAPTEGLKAEYRTAIFDLDQALKTLERSRFEGGLGGARQVLARGTIVEATDANGSRSAPEGTAADPVPAVHHRQRVKRRDWLGAARSIAVPIAGLVEVLFVLPAALYRVIRPSLNGIVTHARTKLEAHPTTFRIGARLPLAVNVHHRLADRRPRSGRSASRTTACGAFSLALLLGTVTTLTSCGKSPGSAAYSLSNDATRAQKLLDTGSLGAASEVLKEALTNSRTDASVLCQYVRCIILSRDPAYPNFIQSPLIADGAYYWATGIAASAATLAVELDPDCRTYLADVILQAFEKRAITTFAARRACIGEPHDLYFPEIDRSRNVSGFELSMVNICWTAIELDPDTARAWAARYRELMQAAIDRGMVASAMMLGNLYGDMIQGGKGTEDFTNANRALFDALDRYSPRTSYDFLRETVRAYPRLFRDELLGDPHTTDPLFAKLKARLAGRGEYFAAPTTESPHNRSFPSGARPR